MLRDNATCQLLCRTSVPPEDAKFINERIREDYALNWLVDGLPAAEMKVDVKTGELFFDMGFNLGDDEGEFSEMPALNNHYDVVLQFVVLLASSQCVTSDRTCLQISLAQSWRVPHRWCFSLALEVSVILLSMAIYRPQASVVAVTNLVRRIVLRPVRWRNLYSARTASPPSDIHIV